MMNKKEKKGRRRKKSLSFEDILGCSGGRTENRLK